jgi:hypothetical protein
MSRLSFHFCLHRMAKRGLASLWALCLGLGLPFFSTAQTPEPSARASLPAFAQLDKTRELSFMWGPFTHHFSKSSEHKYVWLVGIEAEYPDQSIAGATYFSNSFGQPSTYIYPFGKIYKNALNVQDLYFKWSAGLIYGYLSPHQDKVPYNRNGFSPGMIPAIGIQKKNFSAQINFLYLEGLMLQFNFPIGAK